ASNIVSVNGQAGGTEINGVVESVVTSGGILPELVDLTQPTALVVIIGLFITIALMILNVQGAILIGIIATTLLAMVFGLVDLSTVDFSVKTLKYAFVGLNDSFLVIFSSACLPSLFSDLSKLPVVIMTIFAFSLADVFDTIGTFIGTGRRTGIFTDKDIQELED